MVTNKLYNKMTYTFTKKKKKKKRKFVNFTLVCFKNFIMY